MDIKTSNCRGTFFIIILLITIFVFMETTQVNLNASFESIVLNGQYHLLLISIFRGAGHFSLMGIVSLMIIVYIFYLIGQIAENLFGELKLVMIYMVSALVSSLVALFLFRNDVSLGFSLGVTGIIGSVAGYMKSIQEHNFGVNQMLILGLIMLISHVMRSGISIAAYLVACAIGFLIGYLLKK